MGVMSRRVLPACGNLCIFCPSMRARSRQPVKRYKKFLSDIFPRNQFDTKYYYEVGSENVARKFWFITPTKAGPDVPYTFGLIGDLGQTYDSNRTLIHYELNPTKGQTLLFVGDLFYADDHPFHNNIRWDTLGRFIERNSAYQPWIWTTGNHEIDFAPQLGEPIPFKPYLHRFHVLYKESGSTYPLWYSIKRALAYIIVMYIIFQSIWSSHLYQLDVI